MDTEVMDTAINAIPRHRRRLLALPPLALPLILPFQAPMARRDRVVRVTLALLALQAS